MKDHFYQFMTIVVNAVTEVGSWVSSLQFSTEQIALFSILVSILIFTLGKRYEIRFKKHEVKKEQYAKFIKLLNSVFTDNQKEINSDLKQEFFDIGSSLLMYGSKNLYRKYVFYREFSSNPIAQLSKHFDKDLALYILSDLLKTMRNEVGMNFLANISDVEILAFFVNDIAINPSFKIKSYKARFQIRMIKLEIIFIELVKFVFLKNIYYLFIAPVLSTIGLIFKYFLLFPIYGIISFLKKKN